MTHGSTCLSSALRGAAFGASFGAAAGAALLAFVSYAEPTAQPAPVACAPAVPAQAPRPPPRAEAASRTPALTPSTEAGTEPAAAQVQARRDDAGGELLRGGSVLAARTPVSGKAGALARRPPATAGGAPAATIPLHRPRRDPARVSASSDSAPSAGLAPGDLQQMAALLAQLTQGTPGSSSAAGAEGNALSPQLLQKLLGAGPGAPGGAGVSPELLQQLLGGGSAGNALPAELRQKLLDRNGAVSPPDLGL